MTTDLYADLGVERTATQDEIRTAYRKQAREHHPDRGGDAEKMAKANTAYAVLSDTEKRDRYDKTGRADDVPNREELVRTMFKNLVKSCATRPGNIVRLMSDDCREGLKEARQGVKDRKAEVELLKDRMAKISGPTDNMLLEALEESHALASAQLAKAEMVLDLCEEIFKMLMSYSSTEEHVKPDLGSLELQLMASLFGNRPDGSKPYFDFGKTSS